MFIEQFLPAFLDELEHRGEIVPHHWNREQNRELDPHQVEAMSAITNSVRKNLSSLIPVRISVQQAGGAGKTTLITNLTGTALDVRAMQANADGKIIIVTTERALIQGVRKEFYDLGIEEHMLGQWGAGKREIDRPVVLTSIQALQKTKNLEAILPAENNLLVIGDEADTYLTAKRKDTINRLGGMVRIGLSATTKWPDGRHIEDLWGPLVAELSLAEGIQQGVNVPPIFHLYEANIDESSLPIVNGDYDPKEIAQAYAALEIEESITELLGRLVPDENFSAFPCLVYVPTTALVQSVAAKIKGQYPNVKIRQWTGDTTTNIDLQKDVLAYEAGEINILVLCQMGGRGLNLKRARVLIDADPTLSPNKLEQRHSRVLRKLRERESEKPFSINVQIVPRSTKNRCLCLPDIIEEDGCNNSWNAAERGEPLATSTGEKGRTIIEQAIKYGKKLREGLPVVHLSHIHTVDFAKKNIRETFSKKTTSERICELQDWLRDNNGKSPAIDSANRKEKSLASWLCYIRERLRDDPEFAQGEGKVLLEMGIEKATREKNYTERILDLELWLKSNVDHFPSTISQDEHEKSLALWVKIMRTKLRDDSEFAQGEGRALLEMGIKPAKKRERKEKPIAERIGDLQKWLTNNPNQIPLNSSSNKDEKSLRTWLQNMRAKLRDDSEFAQGEGKVLLEMGIKPADKKADITKSLVERLNEWKMWIEEHGEKTLSNRSKDENEKSLANWLQKVRVRLRDDSEFAQGEGKVLLEMGIKPADKNKAKSLTQRIQDLQSWLTNHPNQSPSRGSNDNEEKKIAAWLRKISEKLRDNPEFAQGEGEALLEIGIKPAKKKA